MGAVSAFHSCGQLDQVLAGRDTAIAPGQDFFYIARVELDEASVKERIGKLKLSPGMPAEVYMKTGERTMWQYLVQPIVEVMYHGAREQ